MTDTPYRRASVPCKASWTGSIRRRSASPSRRRRRMPRREQSQVSAEGRDEIRLAAHTRLLPSIGTISCSRRISWFGKINPLRWSGGNERARISGIMAGNGPRRDCGDDYRCLRVGRLCRVGTFSPLPPRKLGEAIGERSCRRTKDEPRQLATRLGVWGRCPGGEQPPIGW